MNHPITWHNSLYITIPAIAVIGMFFSIPPHAMRRGPAGRLWIALACLPAWWAWIFAIIWHQPIPFLACALATCLAIARATWWGPPAQRGRHALNSQDPALADLREWSAAAFAALRSTDAPPEPTVHVSRPRPRGDLRRDRAAAKAIAADQLMPGGMTMHNSTHLAERTRAMLNDEGDSE